MNDNNCVYTRNDKAAYPRVAYDAECGYQFCIMEGYQIGSSGERLSELNLPTGDCRKCKRPITTAAAKADSPDEGHQNDFQPTVFEHPPATKSWKDHEAEYAKELEEVIYGTMPEQHGPGSQAIKEREDLKAENERLREKENE